MRRQSLAAAVAVAFSSAGVAILALPRPSAAAAYYWALPAGQSGDWSVPANWGGTAPSAGDNAYIANGGTAIIDSAGPTCDNLYLGTATGSGNVRMTGGAAGGQHPVHRLPGRR